MKTITICPAEFEYTTENLFILVKNDRPYSVNEVIEVSVQEESIHNFKRPTRLFRISNLMKYHPGIRHSYVAVFLKPYKVPFRVIIQHFFTTTLPTAIARTFRVGRATSSDASGSISIRPIPNNRADSAFRNTQTVKTKKGKIRDLKLKAKKI